jgi:hypothetical protein
MVRAAGGDVAFVHGLARMGEHESVPFCMDDFRAATDLEP